MKIVFISMHSVHAIRWIENLKETSFELFWYDVTNHGKLNTIESVVQFTNLKQRKIPYLKGEFFLSKKFPKFFQAIRPVLEVTENEALESILLKIKPDIVHSFEMQNCSYPILKTMKKFPEIKWIYSCWGNDLYYFQHFKSHRNQIKNVLKRVNFLHTDCRRDYELAKNLGFKGIHTGVIPGGSGYKLEKLKQFKLPLNERKIILVKGYQNIFGRAVSVIQALQQLKDKLQEYKVVVFGAHQAVFDYVAANNLDYKIYGRHALSQEDLLQLMGKSLVYIGNNSSDGMPNTLLEAIVMGAFPIQSNPGNVTAEIITDGENGLLIKDPEDISAIAALISKALDNKEMIEKASFKNEVIAKERLEYEANREKVIALYPKINSENI